MATIEMNPTKALIQIVLESIKTPFSIVIEPALDAATQRLRAKNGGQFHEELFDYPSVAQRGPVARVE
jgi:hypothetical protein